MDIGRNNSVNFNQQGSHIIVTSNDFVQFPNITGLSVPAGTTNNIGATGSTVPGVSSSNAVLIVGTETQLRNLVGGPSTAEFNEAINELKQNDQDLIVELNNNNGGIGGRPSTRSEVTNQPV